ncbi:14010_t:CDS:2 [Acaulospora colombiana]|uniref:14010_t:CDS:1 n=1 Tax=Acaulospora colombiana TaxID=27376 RepID=A0ACA9MP32_9GLOM|nr:14010_t:CDS:2 [Acaulospora colombiana]
MSTSRALNDEEVLNEMNKMVAFIKQEAIEKAREIQVKADEEFNIEKTKLVRQESINIEANFQRKIKQAEVQRKMYARWNEFRLVALVYNVITVVNIKSSPTTCSTQSNYINKSRLKILQARQQSLDELFNEARIQLKKVSQDTDRYRDLLKDLILQTLYQLMDEHVTVIVRKSDLQLAEAAVQAAHKNFTDTTKLPLKIEIDKENFLPDSSAGGVILTSYFGRIKINNTLEERLKLAQEEMLPEIRVTLFGHSPNRKFFN